MNNGFKLDKIKDYFELEKLPEFDDKSILYILKDASLWQYILFNFFATLLIKHYLIYFQPNQIILIKLTLLGDLTKNIKKSQWKRLPIYNSNGALYVVNYLSWSIIKNSNLNCPIFCWSENGKKLI